MWAAARLFLLAFVLLAAPDATAGPHLEVRGTSHFEAEVKSQATGVTLSGTLLDDTDHAIPGAPISIRFVAATGLVVEPWPCSDRQPVAALPNGASAITTGKDGTFCAHAFVQRRTGTTRVTLAFAGTRLVSRTVAELSIDPSRVAVELRFDPEVRGPRIVGLEEGPLLVTAAATTSEDDPTALAAGLPLRLTDERDAPLATALTGADGLARFVVPEERLGPPGPGELRIVFDGDARRASAQRIAACERRVWVVVAPHDGSLAADDIDDGVALSLDVTTPRGAPVSGGAVEGLIDGEVVGAAPVEAGRATLTVRVAGSPREPRLFARYVPGVPWYVAASPTSLALTVRRTVAWKRAAVVGVGLVILGWFSLARSRFLLPAPPPRAAPRQARNETARIDVIARHGDGSTGWEGRVIDAHDGSPIAGAIVVLERAGFRSTELVSRATSNVEGRFVLDGVAARPGDQIAAEGPLHGRLTLPAPPPGLVDVALVSRRRAVLRALVEWARRRGAPFDHRPEATPAQVRRAAQDRAPVVEWASAVERAAFGGGVVDAASEAEVERLGHEAEDGAPHAGSVR